MSNFFGDLNTAGLEKQGDRLGGNFDPVPTDLYKAKIALAYGIKSDGGAKGVVLQFELHLPNETKELRQTIYISKKNGDIFYEKDGKKHMMPGFSTVDDLCWAATENYGFDKVASRLEERHVPVWDKEAKKEIPRPVPVMIDLLDKEVLLAVNEVLEDVTKLNGDKYEPTGETRKSNEIDKVMHLGTRKTITEIREGKEATFADAWQKRNQGKVRDKTDKSKGGAKPGAPGSKPAASGGGQTAAGLFSKGG